MGPICSSTPLHPEGIGGLPMLSTTVLADDPALSRRVLPRDNQVETAASIRMRMRRCWTTKQGRSPSEVRPAPAAHFSPLVSAVWRP